MNSLYILVSIFSLNMHSIVAFCSGPFPRQMASNIENPNGTLSDEVRSNILAQRRCILLALIGSTPSTSFVVRGILESGYLVVVKSWLDDILNKGLGGLDLLLHLLTNITDLPVTKDMVTSSKLGRAVAGVEKHRICVGGKNEAAIKERVTRVKGHWSASVRRMKQIQPQDGKNNNSQKRSMQFVENSSLAKKSKVDDQKEKVSFSSLMKKVSTSGEVSRSDPPKTKPDHVDQGKVNTSSSTAASHSKLERDNNPREKVDVRKPFVSGTIDQDALDQASDMKKKNKRITWADTSGGSLSVSHKLESNEDVQKNIEQEAKNEMHVGDVSWTDRKKRDRLREKELLSQARKSKLIDKEDHLDTMAMMFSSWHKPKLLPPDSDNPPIQVMSKELAVQVSRMASVLPPRYLSEEDVPSNPTPLSEIEQALDMTSQSSAVPARIPFFVPQQEVVPPPVTLPPPINNPPPIATNFPPPPPPPPQLAAPPVIHANPDLVRAMGLPVFLSGQNIQALQTLAASPSLLNTFVDANGNYDQPRLMNLVQTLTQNLPSSQQAPPVPPPRHHQMPNTPSFPTNMPPPPPSFVGMPPSLHNPPPHMQNNYGEIHQNSMHDRNFNKGYRGDQNTNEGNLHISGYGPSTTMQDIINLFSPYVKVDEVVQKSGFSFVNSADAEGARKVKEILQGAILGGNPIKINIAMRRNRSDNNTTSTNFDNNINPYQNNDQTNNMENNRAMRTEAVPLPRNMMGHIDYEQVRDDRGNPATKNLFVAGYGHGSSEEQIREIFGQHCTVTGVVIKGSFAFVNTSDKMAAVHAREALTGSVVNGGVLRINFAKESGRLGTSFDQAYGPASRSHYGRNY